MPHQPTRSWGTRLAALDEASMRLSNKTEALNTLLRQLQAATKVAGSGSAAAGPTVVTAGGYAISAGHYASPSAVVPSLRPPAPAAATLPASPARVLKPSSATLAAASSVAVTSPLAALSVPLSSSTSQALSQIASLQSWLARLAQNLEQQPQVDAAVSSSASPAAPVLPTVLAALNSMATLAQSTPLTASPAKRSALVTIQPLNAGANGMTVNAPKGRAFVNGQWIRTRSHSRGSSLGGEPESEEEPDIFGDISDHDVDATPPRRLSGLLSRDGAAHPSAFSPLAAAAAQHKHHETQDIDEEDVANLVAKVHKHAAPGIDEADENGAGTANEDDDDDDPFGDIEDLPVDPIEEERLRKAEAARTKLAVTTPSVRKALDASKHMTLRPGLFKHMHQDADIDEQEADEVAAKLAAAASHKKPAANEEHDGLDEIISDGDDEPRPDGAVRRPTPHLPKNAPGVTALTTRREGQELPQESWSEFDLPATHLRQPSSQNASQSGALDRPDDLDDLTDEDELSNAARQFKNFAGAAAAATTPSHLKVPSRQGSNASSVRSSPFRMLHSSPRRPFLAVDSDFDADEPHTPHHHHHHHSSSGGSSFSRKAPSSGRSISSAREEVALHGQLSSAVSGDDMDDLDDMMDEDEDESSKKPIVANTKAATDRSKIKLNEFDLSQVEGLLRQSEQQRRDFFGDCDSATLKRLRQLLREPVSVDWLLELAHQCLPVSPASKENSAAAAAAIVPRPSTSRRSSGTMASLIPRLVSPPSGRASPSFTTAAAASVASSASSASAAAAAALSPNASFEHARRKSQIPTPRSASPLTEMLGVSSPPSAAVASAAASTPPLPPSSQGKKKSPHRKAKSKGGR